MKPKFFLLVFIGLVAIFALALAIPARAFDGRGGDTVTIPAGEVIEDDLYVGAGTFTLDGVVKGDLIVAGSTITINGTVEGDLLAAGRGYRPRYQNYSQQAGIKWQCGRRPQRGSGIFRGDAHGLAVHVHAQY